MRRSLFLAALGLAPAGAVAADPAVRILVLGDSLALATGATRADGGFIFPAFRALLRTRPGSRLDNAAIGGSTVADVLRLQTGRIAAAAPDVIVVCAGGNDVVRRTDAGAFAHDYRALLAAARRAAPHARLICCGVPNVALSPIFADERAAIGILSAVDDTVVHAAARNAGARFVDFFAVTQRQRDDRNGHFFSRDRFHPSDAGYALLRNEFEPALLAAAGR